MRADGGDLGGEIDAEARAGDVDLMDGLVADVAVASVPDPVPVIVEAVLGEGLHGSGAGPEVVVDAGGNGLLGSVADGRAPFVAEAARHVYVADGAVSEVLHGLHHGGVGTPLTAMLADAIVFFYRGDELAAFEGIVRARFLDVDVFAGLTGPDGLERVPVIWRGDRDGIDVLVLEDLAEIGAGLRFGDAEFFHVGEALVEDVFVNVTEGDDLSLRNFGEAVNVIDAAAAGAADGHADFVVCA